MQRKFISVLTAVGMCLAMASFAPGQAAVADPAPKRTAAIFVKNRAKNVADEKVVALQDLLEARVSEQGLSIISRDTVLNAVSSFSRAGVNRGDAGAMGTDLDRILSDSTSALRLAQNLGADYILCATIATFDRSTTDFRGEGLATKVIESNLTVSYTLADAIIAKSTTGGVVESTDQIRQQTGLTTDRDPLNALMKDSAGKLAEVLAKKLPGGKLPEPSQQLADRVEFNVACQMGDLTVPEVIKDKDGQYVVTGNRYNVQGMNVNVAVDGITVGTTPGPFQAIPGIHKLRLSAEGFKDWEQTVNVFKGQTLNVSMQMSDAGFARWKETTSFLERLKANSKLSDADVKVLEGYAKMLSQSSLYVPVYQWSVRQDAWGGLTSLGMPMAPTTNPAPAR